MLSEPTTETRSVPEQVSPPARLAHATLNMIVGAFLARFQRIDEAEGEVTAEDEEALDALAPLLEHKVEAYKLAIIALKEDAAAADRIAKSYATTAKRKAAHAERLHERLYHALKAAKRDRVSTQTATASIQQSPPSLKLLVAEADVPEAYVRIKREVDSKTLKAVLQAGSDLPCTCGHAASAHVQREGAVADACEHSGDVDPERNDPPCTCAVYVPIATLEYGEHLRIR